MTRTDITTARSGSENPVGHEMACSAPPADARILLIDDDPAMATMLTLLGRELSYTVDVAADGVEGLHMAREADVDLIVLDLDLPRLTGLNVCRGIRAADILVDPRSIDAHIYRLRRRREPHHDHPTYLHAVPGVGYRFDHRPAVGAHGPEVSSVCTETIPR
jgi:DNA-binding response OmpR family regulator